MGKYGEARRPTSIADFAGLRIQLDVLEDADGALSKSSTYARLGTDRLFCTRQSEASAP